MTTKKFPINRAAVLTLWAFVVAMRQGHDETAALKLGQALAALNAQSKGGRLGINESGEKKECEQTKKAPAPASVRLLRRDAPIVQAPRGIRAALRGEVIQPEAVNMYLEKKFGKHLAEAQTAMDMLANSMASDQLEMRGFSLYE